MKFREFYNPKKVYDGYFETYFIRPFFHHYADFRGPESGKSFFLSIAAWLMVTLGIVGILMGQVGLLGPEVGFSCLRIGGLLWIALSVVPLIALCARKMHGSNTELKTRFLGIDTMLAISCVLFFVLGLLMMVTTLNSGMLDPNRSIGTDEDTSTFKMEEITEEPIFTYQDDAPAENADVADSLSDMTDPDMVTPEESFDPTLTRPDEVLIEQQDSIF